MNEQVKAWILTAREGGLSNDQIRAELQKQGWKEGDIELLVKESPGQAVLTGKDRLESSKSLKIYHRILVGWLLANLVFQFIYILIGIFGVASANISSGYIFGVIFLFSIVLGFATTVFIGIYKVKAWAFWIYGVLLFIGTGSSGSSDAVSTLESVIIGIQILGNIGAFILTIILYNNLFPSKKKLAKMAKSS